MTLIKLPYAEMTYGTLAARVPASTEIQAARTRSEGCKAIMFLTGILRRIEDAYLRFETSRRQRDHCGYVSYLIVRAFD